MKKNIITTTISIMVLVIALLPLVAGAQAGGSGFQWGNLVPCGTDDPRDCTVDSFIELIFNVITAVIILGIGLSSIMFAYAGFLYITSQGNQEQVKRATRIFKHVAIGLFSALIAYLVIQLIVESLGLSEDVPINFN